MRACEVAVWLGVGDAADSAHSAGACLVAPLLTAPTPRAPTHLPAQRGASASGYRRGFPASPGVSGLRRGFPACAGSCRLAPWVSGYRREFPAGAGELRAAARGRRPGVTRRRSGSWRGGRAYHGRGRVDCRGARRGSSGEPSQARRCLLTRMWSAEEAAAERDEGNCLVAAPVRAGSSAGSPSRCSVRPPVVDTGCSTRPISTTRRLGQEPNATTRRRVMREAEGWTGGPTLNGASPQRVGRPDVTNAPSSRSPLRLPLPLPSPSSRSRWPRSPRSSSRRPCPPWVRSQSRQSPPPRSVWPRSCRLAFTHERQLATSRRKPATPGASRKLPAQAGNSRRQPEPPVGSRKPTARAGHSRRKPETHGASRTLPARAGNPRRKPGTYGGSREPPASAGSGCSALSGGWERAEWVR